MAEATPIEPAPPPRRESFKEVDSLPDEPRSDIAIKAGGMRLRERVQSVPGPHGYTLLFTYTRLTESGEVERNKAGEPIISDPHEVQFDGEDGPRVGMEGRAAALKHGREVAVARAVDTFRGLDALPKELSELMSGRV